MLHRIIHRIKIGLVFVNATIVIYYFNLHIFLITAGIFLLTFWYYELYESRRGKSYMEEFPGYYKTADAGFIDEDGYAFVMTRTDDIINVAGHRLSTGAMEEVLAGHHR